MISPGDVVFADLRREPRIRVVVVSNARFHRLDDRALVVPEAGTIPGPDAPWFVQVGGLAFAVNAALTVEQARLLDVVGRATIAELEHLRRVLRFITA